MGIKDFRMPLYRYLLLLSVFQKHRNLIRHARNLVKGHLLVAVYHSGHDAGNRAGSADIDLKRKHNFFGNRNIRRYFRPPDQLLRPRRIGIKPLIIRV